jgi:hypothetical protein
MMDYQVNLGTVVKNMTARHPCLPAAYFYGSKVAKMPGCAGGFSANEAPKA